MELNALCQDFLYWILFLLVEFKGLGSIYNFNILTLIKYGILLATLSEYYDYCLLVLFPGHSECKSQSYLQRWN